MHLQQHKKSSNGSSTDVRRSLTATDMSKYKRPSLSRKHTPSAPHKSSRSQRDRDEMQDLWDEDRESFPHFCTVCDKQFVAHNSRHLYCSDSCRRSDQNYAPQPQPVRTQSSGHYPFYSAGSPEPRDIVPRASPSRPGSMHFSNSPPTSPGSFAYAQPSSAISSLRSLNVRPPSPPSPTSTGSAIWPFSRSAATSPSTSYSRPSAPFFSSTYDPAYAGGGYTYDMGMGSGGMDRPLPSRQPAGYSRPKSIELVTPMVSR